MKNIRIALSIVICYLICAGPSDAVAASMPDSLIAKEITRLLDKESNSLHFPGTVRRLYRQAGRQTVWIRPQNGEGPAWQVMMMLDCVLQYGLSPVDYHPAALTYNRLHHTLDTIGKTSIKEAARLDILLSDAMITLMNHLHYGKFNPYYSAAMIDNDQFKGFHADSAILQALREKRPYDFWANAETVQPVGTAYRDLQHRMRVLEGQYGGDNYLVSVQEMRQIAVNMERLRWQQTGESDHILVNLPAYSLSYHHGDSDLVFRVVIGSAVNQTPELISSIGYLTAAPDVAIPQDRFIRELLPGALRDTAFFRKNQYALYDKKGRYVPVNRSTLAIVALHPGDYRLRHASGHDGALGRLVFRFNNAYRIDLHDMPRKAFFEQNNRAITTGCIWLDEAGNLGQLILVHDGQAQDAAQLRKAMKKYQRKVFVLRQPLPIIITYLTCIVQDGALVTYPDIYHKDADLARKLFPVNELAGR